MATISSHTLNGVDGTHADGIGVTLFHISADGARIPLFTAETDANGRISKEVMLDGADLPGIHEIVFATNRYWADRAYERQTIRIVDEIVLRFAMADPNGRYHIPVILAPNSYSIWWSG